MNSAFQMQHQFSTKSDKTLRIFALIATRNDATYLQILLPFLAAQNIAVIILDHDSHDSTDGLLQEYSGRPVASIIKMPYKGYFSLMDQLQTKQKAIQQISCDWLIHHDVDEILEGRNGEPIREVIVKADQMGYNVVNFDEFVFLPPANLKYSENVNYLLFDRYYFFQPHDNRLNRAFKKAHGIENVTLAGHKIKGKDIAVYPENQTLRHYIVLSEKHARDKYLSRIYDPIDLEKGWHKNRLHFTEQNLSLPKHSPHLHFLEKPGQKQTLNRKKPTKRHYWDW